MEKNVGSSSLVNKMTGVYILLLELLEKKYSLVKLKFYDFRNFSAHSDLGMVVLALRSELEKCSLQVGICPEYLVFHFHIWIR